MQLEIINTRARFAELRAAWDAIYAADTDAKFFQSWTWLSEWFRFIDRRWFVIAARADGPDGGYLGFRPLQKHARTRNGKLYAEVSMGGSRMADHTGFICLPAAEREVTTAFAAQLAKMPWSELRLDWLSMSDARTNLFLSGFSSRQFERVNRQVTNSADGVDLSISPFVWLPESWDGYLASHMGSNTRQKARRFLRRLDTDGALRVAHATPDSFDRDFETMMRFWRAKWSHRKGEATESIVRSFAVMLRHCAQTGTLFMPMLWRGDTPLGGLAFLVDAQKKALLFKVSGLDTSGNNPPPGFLLHAYSIRQAIAAGYKTYDLLLGNEPYKYTFGVEERRIRNIGIRRRTPKPLTPRVVARSHAGLPGYHAAGSSPSAPELPQFLSGFVPLEARIPPEWKPSPPGMPRR